MTHDELFQRLFPDPLPPAYVGFGGRDMTDWKVGDVLALFGDGVAYGVQLLTAEHAPRRNQHGELFHGITNAKYLREPTERDFDHLIACVSHSISRESQRLQELVAMREKWKAS